MASSVAPEEHNKAVQQTAVVELHSGIFFLHPNNPELAESVRHIVLYPLHMKQLQLEKVSLSY